MPCPSLRGQGHQVTPLKETTWQHPGLSPWPLGLPPLSAIVPGIAVSAPVCPQSLPNLKTRLQNCIVLSGLHKLLPEYCMWLAGGLPPPPPFSTFFVFQVQACAHPCAEWFLRVRKLVVYLRPVHLGTNTR